MTGRESMTTATTPDAGTTVPLVNYLVLGDEPHLVAQECETCRARYFGRRSGCACCSGDTFTEVPVPTEGTVTAFSIVEVAAPGIEVPFVSVVVDCAQTTVRANLVDVVPDPVHVRLGMPVRLTTYSLGIDERGVQAIGFAFAPVGVGR